jgi:hypothetical protein
VGQLWNFRGVGQIIAMGERVGIPQDSLVEQRRKLLQVVIMLDCHFVPFLFLQMQPSENQNAC